MPSEWKKVIVSGSQAQLKSLYTDGSFIVSGSLIILNDLPTSDPYISGRLWKYDSDEDGSYLMVSKGCGG